MNTATPLELTPPTVKQVPESFGDSVLKVLAVLTVDDCQPRVPDTEPGSTVPQAAPGAPVSFPAHRYTFAGEIASGGMGAVLRGRDEDLGREIAVKVLLDAHRGKAEFLRRFVEEARIAGQLQHPGVTPVYELGRAPDGRPYFTMKLVQGETLAKLLSLRFVSSTDHTTALAESRPRFLKIFEQICQTLAYAHARGVLHRDLKPHNIMVGAFGEVQVMDWGLAKSLRPGDQETRRHGEEAGDCIPLSPGLLVSPSSASDVRTQAGAVLGTPAYMPPEQARGKVQDLDERSDVFSLGAILCEILTGTPPYAGPSTLDALAQAQQGKVESAFAELDQCGAEAELVALAKRCLAASPAERPRDAGVLAQEMTAHLQGVEQRLRHAELAAVAARTQADEETKRRRVTFRLAAGILLALAAGLAASLWQMNRAFVAEQQTRLERDEKERARQAEAARAEGERQAKEIARIERDEKERARQAEAARAEGEKQAKEIAQKRLVQLEKGNQILAALFKDLDPWQEEEGGKPWRELLGERLDAVAKQLEGEAVGDPLTVARLQYTLGESLLGLGRAEQAIALFTKVRDTRAAHLGPDHRDTLLALANLARGHQDAGRLAQAIPLMEDVLRRQRAALGPEDADTLHTMDNLGWAYYSTDRLDKAVPLFREALRGRRKVLGEAHTETLISMNSLATSYLAAGQPHLAKPLFEETLQRRRKGWPADHPDLLTSMCNLALCHQAMNRLDLAMPLYQEVLQRRKARLGPTHPATLESMNNLAFGYQAAQDWDRAIPLFAETHKLRQAKHGDDHPDTILTLNNLAWCRQHAGDPGGALPLFEKAGQGIEKLRYAHSNARHIISNVIECHEELQQFAQAEGWRRKWLAELKTRGGSDSPPYAAELAGLGLNLLHQKKYADAEPVLRECLALRQKQQPDAWTTFSTQSMLGGALLGQKKLTEAEPLLVQGYQGMKQREQQIPPPARIRLVQALERLVQLHEATGKMEQAATWRKELEQARGTPGK